MSEAAATESGAAVRPATAGPGWRVREATAADAAACAVAVGELLDELGGRRPSPAQLDAEVRALLGDREGGVLFVAEDVAGALVGVLGASWQRAIHVPGRYAIVQDLWVDRRWRSRKVGAGLIEALAGLARERGVFRIEVGLPRETFAAIGATEAFYRANGFEPLGARMRRLLE